MAEMVARTGYLQVQDAVRQRIVNGQWRRGDKIPSERELEKEFQISRLTISKGLAQLVAEGMLVRKRGQGTFVSDMDPAAGRKSKLVTYISPLGADARKDTVRHGILEGMYEVLSKHGLHVGVDFYRTPEEMIPLLRQDDENHAGFVIWPQPGDAIEAEIQRLRNNGVAFVLVDAFPENLETDFVVNDNVEGGRMAINYLAERGHRQIGYITLPIDRTSLRDRQAGFLQGLISQNLPFSPGNMVALRSPGSESRSEVGCAVDRLLSANPSLTAILFSTDDLALTAIQHLRGKGIRVPEDISIVGYDGIDRSEYGPVPLTTVTVDFFEMGKTAAEILWERLTGNGSPRPAQVFVKPRLVERESVGRSDQ